MKGKFRALTLGALVLIGTLGCGITDTILNNAVGGSKGSSVANLWSDVPPLEGGQKLTLDLPVTMQLAIQGLMKASASTNEVQLDKFDWIAYSTPQTPDQVTAYYSIDRMTAAGWNLKDQPGCNAGSDTSGLAGGFCIFGKGKGTTNDKGAILFIIIAQDDKTKPTQVYYVRLEGLVNKTPTK
jgi:hypothetical protein